MRFDFQNRLPASVATVLSLLVAVLMCYLGLWLLAWLMHWCAIYGFLPWPSL